MPDRRYLYEDELPYLDRPQREEDPDEWYAAHQEEVIAERERDEHDGQQI